MLDAIMAQSRSGTSHWRDEDRAMLNELLDAESAASEAFSSMNTMSASTMFDIQNALDPDTSANAAPSNDNLDDDAASEKLGDSTVFTNNAVQYEAIDVTDLDDPNTQPPRK